MKKLRKLQDGIGGGGAVGNGVPIGSAAAGASGIGGGLPKGLKSQIREGSVRTWIFDHSRRLRQAGLKRHEIRYMDLTKSEAQLIRKKPRPKRSGQTQELSGNFLGEEKMVSGDSDGTVQVKRSDRGPFFNKAIIIGAVTGLIFSLLVLTIF